MSYKGKGRGAPPPPPPPPPPQQQGDAELKWSSEDASGGNVLSWLAKKTNSASNAAAVPSKGAIEYFQKQDAPSVPKPRSKQHTDPAAPAATAGGATVPSIADLAKLFPGHAQEKVASKDVKATTQQHAAAADVKPAVVTHVVAAPPKSSNARPTREQRQQQAKNAKRDQRRDAHQANEANQLKAEAEHTRRLESDEEYRNQFETFKQVQRNQQDTQNRFFGQYNNQEVIQPGLYQQERLDLPVILDLIEQHDVVFICTDTGSGKSTSIPKALLEANNTNRIVSTQPRRTATTAIANRVASLRRERVGDDVGYWIRGEKRGDTQTRLWYMTSYTLLLHLLNHPLNPPFTHIVLDEFHERQPDVEVTAALLKLCLKNRTAKFKLILMSATLNTDDWEQYFEGLTVATYKQSEPDHPIHDYFMEDVCSMVGIPHSPPLGLTQNVVDQQLLEKHLFAAQTLIMNLNHCVNPQHSILVFLPGRAQVENFQMWLEMTMAQRVDIIPWHSAVDLSTIEAAIQRRPYGKQKIYLATDIAEVSITLPDVVFVIDMVLVKRPQIQTSQPATIMYPPLVV